MIKKPLEDNKIDSSEKVEHLKMEVSILRDAYFQLEKAIAAKAGAEHDLRERYKELNCLFTIDVHSRNTEATEEQYFQGVVNAIPSAMQYSEIAAASIFFAGKEYSTENYKKTKWCLGEDIIVNDNKEGSVEVNYSKGAPNSGKSPFLDEEENLMRSIAQRIKEYVERKRALINLQKSAIYIDSMGEALMVLDTQRRIVKLNKAGLKLWGYTEEESLKLTVEDVIPKREHEKQYASMGEVIKKGAIDPFETAIVTKEGKEIPVLLSGTLIEDDSGKPAGFTGVFRDITERKEAEKKLKDSKESLTTAQQIAHLGNWDWNIVTNELWWSDEIFRIFGLKPLEFKATYDAFLGAIHPEDRDFVDKSVKEALIKNNYSLDHRIILPSGEVRFVHEEAKVAYDRSGKPTRMLGIVQDITDIRKAQAQATQLAIEKIRTKEAETVVEEMKKLDKMKDEFLDIASHELRTPLTAIRGNSSLILEYFSDKLQDEQMKEVIDDIHKGSVRLTEIVNDFLNVSRLEGGRIEFKKQKLDLQKLVSEVVGEFGNIASQKNLVLQFEEAPGRAPSALGDETRT
ncbi:hypothetical protein DRH13_01735 [Candidatus Woesebacteria bacterium]|nr:MAG: hypothetical protein DRH13_01735 [Candidatus Woesebacteria bacterium]